MKRQKRSRLEAFFFAAIMAYGLVVILCLSGCAQVPIIKTVQVKIPVSVPCEVQPIPVPDWALDHVTETDSDYVWARAALVEIGQHYAYETRLNAAIDACR